MDTQALHRHIIEAEALRAQLRAEFGDDEETLILDTLEGATDLDKVIDKLDAALFGDEGLVAGIEAQQKVLAKRKERLLRRIELQQGLVKKALEIAGWKSRESPYGTYSQKRKAPCLGKLDEPKIPPKYWIQPDPRLDRVALLDALKKGEKVTGASLEPETTILQVRRA